MATATETASGSGTPIVTPTPVPIQNHVHVPINHGEKLLIWLGFSIKRVKVIGKLLPL